MAAKLPQDVGNVPDSEFSCKYLQFVKPYMEMEPAHLFTRSLGDSYQPSFQGGHCPVDCRITFYDSLGPGLMYEEPTSP